MKYNLVGELPKHQYCFVDSRQTHRENKGFVPCVWFGLLSYPSRVWGATVMLESGAVYRNIPINALTFDVDSEYWNLWQAQTWNCYSDEFTLLEYKYLSGLRCKTKCMERDYLGEYLFSVHPIGDGFSHYPEQAKEFCFIKLDNGRITVQPTNRVVFRESSFTDNLHMEFPNDLKHQSVVYSVPE